MDDEYYLNSTKSKQTLSEYIHKYNDDRSHVSKSMIGFTPTQKYLVLQQKSVTIGFFV